MVALIAMVLTTALMGLDLLGTVWGVIRGYYAFTSIFRAGFHLILSSCLAFFFFVSFKANSH